MSEMSKEERIICTISNCNNPTFDDLKSELTKLLHYPGNTKELVNFISDIVEAAKDPLIPRPFITKQLLERAGIHNFKDTPFYVEFYFARQTQFYGGVSYYISIQNLNIEKYYEDDLLNYIDGDFFDYNFFTADELCHGEMELPSESVHDN